MPRIRLITATLGIACLAATAGAQDKESSSDKHRNSRGINVTSNDVDGDGSCAERLRISSDDYAETQRAEESHNFPNQPMKVTASRNGGIQVRTTNRSDIAVKVCKAAGARDIADARAVLDKIKLNASGNVITVEGPENIGGWRDNATWSALIVIEAPVGATFDLSAFNGGISAKQFNGNLTAETRNGGISLAQSTGKLVVEALNGGISIKDCGGDVKATVQNGGLSIELPETWNGAGLEARTQNGGLVIAVPRTMQSGVEVAMKGHGSIVCQSDACSFGQRTWDDDGKIVRFGSGNTVIRASTVNGGTVIKERGRSLGKL
jgi:DUF4097 and DUF4098 domain-containing protein YvlB